MRGWVRVGAACLGMAATGAGAAPLPDAAERFGARMSATSVAVSPDGRFVSYVAPAAGQANALVVAAVSGGAPRVALRADGSPGRLRWCDWVSDARLMCLIAGVSALQGRPSMGFERWVAVDADGGRPGNPVRRRDPYDRGQWAGALLSMGRGDGRVLMELGGGTDWVDTVTGAIEPADRGGQGVGAFIVDPVTFEPRVGFLSVRDTTSGQWRDEVRPMFRPKGVREWRSLSVPGVPFKGREALRPVALDPATDSVFAWAKSGGRDALFRVSLDGAARMSLAAAHPEADVDGLLRLGRFGRVVGVDVVTDRRRSIWFDPETKRLAESLGRAIPRLPLIEFSAASRDERKLVLLAHADDDPGRYYLFDRDARKLTEIMLARPRLEGVTVAKVEAVTFPAADGTSIPGYLTMPPGGARTGLRAIVMPHGGPSARDEWGFDWMAQYFAHLGYAVLQPNFRGSAGYGEQWFGKNGFRDWATAIGDINAGGRWLETSGVAAKGKLAIVAWSYGGYAALQGQVAAPGLYRASVAIAPVTDFRRVIEENRGFTNYELVRSEVGGGPWVAAGSPVNFGDRFTAPVLMFHGDRDLNVRVGQARAMDEALRKAGKQSRLVVFEGLDHQLEDSSARARMLREAGAFLDEAMR